MKEYWARIVGTAFGVTIIFVLFTAHFTKINVGWEIWWEVPVFILLTISIWLVKNR